MTPRPTSRPNISPAPLPPYCQLREALPEQIETLRAGQPIPSERELRLARHVSCSTVRKAVNPAHVEIAAVAAK